jgi:6-phosphogluconolactonase
MAADRRQGRHHELSSHSDPLDLEPVRDREFVTERASGMADTTLYAAIGPRLTHYGIDIEAAALSERGSFMLPEGLQYLCRHASEPIVYAACSDGRPGHPGTRHFACALKMGPTGTLSLHGTPLALAARPVHIATDSDSRHAFIAYPNPSRIGVHRIHAGGVLGTEEPSAALPPLPKMAHQVVVSSDNERLLVPLRGNDGGHGRAEDPGALLVLDCRDGKLSHRQTLAPEGGYGFGPRHVAFHPSKPWLYMSIERQNEIALFDVGERMEGPKFRCTTLERPDQEKPRQLVGAIHVHPNGRFVYVSNRADGTIDEDDVKVFNGGENSIAVFAIDPVNGRPTRVENADSRGIHPRTFHIHPSGRLLVAANMTSRRVRDREALRTVPGGLSVFRIGDDGRLSFMRKYDADVANAHMFWMGMVALLV